MINFLKGTNFHKNYWINRKNWVQGYVNSEALNHPHRKLIVKVLSTFNWLSLIEIGCASGANLINIVKFLPGRQVGGIDVSQEAIDEVTKNLKGAWLKVGSGDDILMSDKSTDVVISDMTLIYVSPRDIGRYIKEIRRVARNRIVLCEFHSASWWNRLALKINRGYNAYNWDKLLQKYEFYDIIKYKLTEQDWPGGEPQKTFGYIIKASVPKYV